MANQKKTHRKFLDNFILILVVGCMVLIAVHQTINVVDYITPEPTPTRIPTGSSGYVGDGVIKDEDILEPEFTPTPTPPNP